jgi:hypothetical protein
MLFAIIAVTAVLALSSSVLFQEPGLLGRDKELVDFDAFYVAGQMAERGQAVETYDAGEMMAAQRQFSGTIDFMPWTYLPPYLLVVQMLAQLPIGISFLAFFAATFGFYLFVVRRIAGQYLPGVMIAILPTILALARTGQNGFLTAGLIGAFLLAFSEGRRIAGLPLGLMVIKPHLAAAVALLALLDRRWSTIAMAGGIVAASLLAATTAYGMAIWPAFFSGLRDAGQFLAAAYYPLYRMSSIYAAVLAFGGSPTVALAVHLAGALGAVGVLVWAYVRRWEPRLLAATACVSSVFISPYNYDYDLAIIGIAIAFVLPEVLEKARRSEIVALTLLTWAATGYGLAVSSAMYGANSVGVATSAEAYDDVLSLTAPLLILLVASGLAVLRRQSVDGRSVQTIAVAG